MIILNYIINNILLLLVVFVGIVLSVVYWRKHPRVSLYVIIALSLCVINRLFSWLFLPGLLKKYPPSTETFEVYFLISSLVNLISFSLLIVAIFYGRKSTDQQN